MVEKWRTFWKKSQYHFLLALGFFCSNPDLFSRAFDFIFVAPNFIFLAPDLFCSTWFYFCSTWSYFCSNCWIAWNFHLFATDLPFCWKNDIRCNKNKFRCYKKNHVLQKKDQVLENMIRQLRKQIRIYPENATYNNKVLQKYDILNGHHFKP